MLSYEHRNLVRIYIINNLQMSKMQNQSSSQWLKALGHQRALFRLGSQCTYFKDQKGIGAENKK